MQRWFASVRARDYDALRTMYTPGCRYERSHGVSVGPDAAVEYQSAFLGAFPDHAFRVEELVVAGDAVVVEGIETGTHTRPYIVSPLEAIPPTGRTFSMRVVEVFRFIGEQIDSQHEYYDLLTFLRQLGWLDSYLSTTSLSALG